jgi:hypothetical protein
MSLTIHPPPAVGVHGWLFGRARFLQSRGVPAERAAPILEAAVRSFTFRPGRSVHGNEIRDAVESAFRRPLVGAPRRSPVNAPLQLPDDFDPVAGWPAEMSYPAKHFDRAAAATVLAEAGSLGTVDLWERSPVRPEASRAPRFALELLFAPGDLLCVGRSSDDFEARPLSEWGDADLVLAQFIVPNPLRKTAGITKRGTTSAHCRDAVGARRYLVVECDSGLSHDQQAAILEHLRMKTAAPLVCAVLSGGKSLHGWFNVAGMPATRLRQWFAYAVRLGADKRMWLPEQFARLPDGRRENGAAQNVIFLAPA